MLYAVYCILYYNHEQSPCLLFAKKSCWTQHRWCLLWLIAVHAQAATRQSKVADLPKMGFNQQKEAVRRTNGG